MPKVIETVGGKAKMQTGFSGLLDQCSFIPISSCCPGAFTCFCPLQRSLLCYTFSLNFFLQDPHFFDVLLSKGKKKMLFYSNMKMTSKLECQLPQEHGSFKQDICFPFKDNPYSQKIALLWQLVVSNIRQGFIPCDNKIRVISYSACLV